MGFFFDDDLTDGELVLRLTGTAPALPERGILPACSFDITLPDGTRLGTCDLRLGSNEMTRFNGNIGYTVFPPFRGHHYAAKACRLLLPLARRWGMDSVVITCDEANIPSRKTCEKCGGVLTELVTVPEDSDLYRRGKRRIRLYTVKT